MLLNLHKRRLFRMLTVLALATTCFAKDPPYRQKGVLSGMQSVACGTTEKSGTTVAGALITGSKHSKTQELLCQEYTVQTDRVTYRIQPREEKHPVLLPVGEEAEFRLKKDRMLLRIPELDNKEREYTVLSMTASHELSETLARTQHPPKPHRQELEPETPAINDSRAAASEPGPVTSAATDSSATQGQTASAAPPASATAPSAPATLGFVRIQSTPDGAEIYIDSAFAGHTPTTLKLSPGLHSVQVVNAGYKDFVSTINVAPGVQQQLTAALSR